MPENKKLAALVTVAIDWQKTRDDFRQKASQNSLSLGGMDPSLARKFTEALESFSNQAIVILDIRSKPLLEALVEVLGNALHQLPE